MADLPLRAPRRRWSFRVASVGGVALRLHVTFVLLVALVALAAGAAGDPVVAAVGWLLLLFASVVVHELAHATVARSHGIEVEEIELLPIGGMARLERLPDDWPAEIAIAVAGPATSAVLGSTALAAAAATGQAVLPVTLGGGAVLTRLGWVNLLLAGFNLLPALPLDGGRIYRAVLERRYQPVEATRRAAAASRRLAVALVVVGVVLNPWLIVIAFFVLTVATQEELAALVHAALGTVPVGRIAAPCTVRVAGDLHAGDLDRWAFPAVQPGYVVVTGGRDLGVVTPPMLRAAAPGTELTDLAATTLVDASTVAEDVLEATRTGPVGVTVAGRVVGVVTPDLLEAELRRRLAAVS